ncbi:MAG: menaquinone biosynthesis family protein [Aquificaceae bacterium]
MKIRIAHSPDSDDAFMFYPLVAGEIKADGFQIEHVLKDIETLNEEAFRGTYEVSAISFHAYPYVSDKYLVLPSGGSVGDGYGPILVAKDRLDGIRGKRIAVPGRLTTAYLVLKLYEPNFEEMVVPFDKVMDEIESGRVDVGLVIHEGQISYKERGLEKILDLGGWWKEKFNLPLPLGCNVVRRDLGRGVIKRIEELMRESVKYALTHMDKALVYARDYAREIKNSEEKTKRFVSMYVNQRTVDYGEDGRKAVRFLLSLGRERGIVRVDIPHVMFSDEI